MITSINFKEVLIKYLSLEDITADEINDNDPLFGDEGLGLDSVDSIELVLAIEKEYAVRIEDATQYREIFSSVQSLLDYINEQKK
ncbi:MAG: Acyl carrier protein [uncultured Sulfurovum sp.]|uniref:Acyl carrier protein n=1 Tax=uncultured Sulfurovum sp. TaxID=269237 RepID=A0A6S6TGL1_9BACT|nr:MAG: Acyl carrier protein [uncultured Sulfurovum sp.]